jgi:two-component system, OmpR family, KDP operon response regulator KdpE
VSAARVLVCDDEPQILRALRVVLREAGFEVVPAATAAAALDVAAVSPPDAAILDLVLPDGDGIAVCRSLREWSQMPIIVLSAVGDEDEKVRALEAGADDYVVKPYVTDELLARVRALLRRTGRLASQVTQVGRLVVDEPAHRVTVDDSVVDLGPTDFALLAVLARHAGQVLSKSRLLELVWGYEAVDENVVEVHVSILRRRLGQDAADLIHTVRGVGYVLRDSHPGDLQDS